MIKDGLFDCFLCDVVFGLYNWLGVLVGVFGMCIGVLMVLSNEFCIMIKGKGVYVVLLYNGNDLVFVGV